MSGKFAGRRGFADLLHRVEYFFDPRDPLHDEPFAAAYAAKIILEARGLVEGYSFWTFSDIFDENYFPSVPFQGGLHSSNLHGIAKPVYRAFELLHRLGTEI